MADSRPPERRPGAAARGAVRSLDQMPPASPRAASPRPPAPAAPCPTAPTGTSRRAGSQPVNPPSVHLAPERWRGRAPGPRHPPADQPSSISAARRPGPAGRCAALTGRETEQRPCPAALPPGAPGGTGPPPLPAPIPKCGSHTAFPLRPGAWLPGPPVPAPLRVSPSRAPEPDAQAGRDGPTALPGGGGGTKLV